ncbi:CPBP family intramembrane glutamic endopeptidase [Halorubrum depositum]|uniref:CPBP family intramembrane glutamic endopeptidase n=1 Tax=Halorubrum depositum TaxID=2583992 RepID=UPI0011A49E55|nr:CPBP family intramembrane glutamic endopeptidase [Halorubrum depositum]
MPNWAAFALATAALTLSLLYLTRRSQRLLERARIADSRSEVDVEREFEGERDDADAPPDGRPVLTTRLLLANAATSQTVGFVVLVAVAWWTAVPAAAFGIGGAHPTLGFPAFASLGSPALAGLGVAAGVGLAAGNEAAARLGTRAGLAPSDRLRAAMAPGTAGEWVLLLGVALPVVALFEEALFRGALVGALAAGFAVDPWLLAVGSSVAFGLGHGAQGRLGIAVAGALGLALAGLFVATGSLLVPVVAHYVVNAAEFAAHEGP